MILIDTSAWVDYLRSSDTAATREVRRLIDEGAEEIATCEPVAMELLAGAPDEVAFARIEQLVNGLPSLAVDTATDFRGAASMFRLARRGGRTVRSLNDCVIATIAIRHGVSVLHKDVDFEVIAAVSGLDAISLR